MAGIFPKNGLAPGIQNTGVDLLVDRLVGMDPDRVTTVARRVATRIAADQVAAAQLVGPSVAGVDVQPRAVGGEEGLGELGVVHVEDYTR